MAALITEAVEPTETGIATGINTVMRTVGAVIGAQVGAAILTATTLQGTAVPTEGAYVSAFALVGRRRRRRVIAVFVTQRGGDGAPSRGRAGMTRRDIRRARSWPRQSRGCRCAGAPAALRGATPSRVSSRPSSR